MLFEDDLRFSDRYKKENVTVKSLDEAQKYLNLLSCIKYNFRDEERLLRFISRLNEITVEFHKEWPKLPGD